MAHEFKVGQRVTALVSMYDDLVQDGLGMVHCANKGEELIVRKVSQGYKYCISVSHEHITDRAFCVAPEEIVPVTPNVQADAPPVGGRGQAQS
jgi:hypothetical protein